MWTLQALKPLSLFSMDAPANLDIATYHVHYDEQKIFAVLDEIDRQYERLQYQGYKPKRLILGTEEYLHLIAHVSHHSRGITKPTQWMGVKIELVSGNRIDVLPSNEDTLHMFILEEDSRWRR